MAQRLLRVISVDQQIKTLPLEQFMRLDVEPGASYRVIDANTNEVDDSIILKKQGNALVIEGDEQTLSQIDNFYSEDIHASFEVANQAVSDETALVNDSQLITSSDQPQESSDIVWQAAEAEQSSAWSNAAFIGLGGAGLVAVGVAANSSHSESSVTNTVNGSIVAGPVVNSNDLKVIVYQADGTTVLGEGSIDASGQFSIAVGSYSGVVIAKVENTGTEADYLDEATNTAKDLNAELLSTGVVTTPNSTLTLNINVLTTVAYSKALEAAAGQPLDTDTVNHANTAIAHAFGLSDLQTTEVVTTNGETTFNAEDGLNEGETYGAVLAALSGADQNNAGNSQTTIDHIVAHTTLNGSTATLDQTAQEEIIKGGDTANLSVIDDITKLIDRIAPNAHLSAAIDDVGSVTGELSSGDTTDDSALALSGNCESGSTVNVYNGTTLLGAATVTGISWHYTATVEDGTRYQFNVKETDVAGNESAASDNYIVIGDTTAPTLTNTSSALTIDENSGAAQVVYTATSEDSASAVTYSLAGTDADLFSIDDESGEVSLTGEPDYEAKPSYSFTVVASDTAGNSTEQAVSLSINNLDEVAPKFTSAEATAATIDENSGAAQVVYTATATDGADISGGVTYSLKVGDDAALFSIDDESGEVILTGNPDYEAKPSYSFTVVASDAAGNSTEQAVSLAINNLDDTKPKFTSGDEAATIDENSGAAQVVYTATATDDGDISDGVTYSLAGTDADLFSIDDESGEVSLTGDPDYEAKPSYSFTVVASDVAGNSTEQAVSLAINNLDDTKPKFTSGDEAATIDENSGAAQVVYTATATDDGDVSDGVTYSLAGTDADLFSIDDESGEVSLTGNPDYEAKPNYSFTVVASDVAGNSTEQAVSLAINNLDDTKPKFTSGDEAATIDENSGAAQVVYTATATDDGDVSDGVTYSLAGTDADLFSIDDESGEVSLTDDPNYEAKPNYSFTVVASDVAGNSTEQAVSLAINNLDDTKPKFTSGDEAATIDENSGAAQVVYTATATDDGDVSDGVTYSLAGTDADLFSIDDESGEVSLTGNPDYEAKPNYSFTVVASDVAGNSTEQAVSLAINNLDDTKPKFTSGDEAATIDENSGAAQVVYTATATDDGDVSDGVTYSLAGTDADLFSIDDESGEVSLTDDPNYEAKPNYSFTVVASDVAGNSTEQAVSLAINNLDDTKPKFSTEKAEAATIDENSGAAQVVYTATATDDGDVSDGVTYSLAGTDADLFSIDDESGEVSLTGNPDYEAKPNYSFTVVASDVAGNSTEQAVSLAINNLDDTKPKFTSGDEAATIDENSGAAQVVYTATATDDGDVSDGVTYSLAGTDADLFSIDDESGEVSLTDDPDYEAKPSYSFTVVASDAAGNSTEQAVSLAINNLDDTKPKFTSGDEAATIDENSGAAQVVYTATATDDGDVSDGVTYSLAGTDADLFSIDDESGEVSLTGNPDYEAKPNYSFTVVASDVAGNSTEQAVSLAINNLDDTKPKFTSGDEAATIDENSGAAQVVYTATATDDGDVSDGVTYSLAGTDADLFSIDDESGEVSLTGNPDYEAKPNYSFTVVASDVAGNSTEQAVSLAINNLDDTKPKFTSGDEAATIDENSGAAQVVYTATATDDGDVSDGVTYSLAGTDADLFSIDDESGEVSLTDDPNYEAKPNYSFTVVASDVAGNSTEQAVSLAIRDISDETPPKIQGLSINNSTMAIDDVVTVTITVDSDEDAYQNLSGTVGGYDLSNLIRVDSTTYTAQFTVTEGGADVLAGDDIDVSLSLEDTAGNKSATYSKSIAQGSDAIDAHSPEVLNVTIADTAMKVGDVVVTLTVANDSGDTYKNLSGTVGGYKLSDLAKVDNTTYTAQFTVTEGDADVLAGDDIDVSLSLEDTAGNKSATYSKSIAQGADAIDAHSPSNTFTDASYDVASHTLTLTGSNMTSLLSDGETSSTNIKGNLDWSKLHWDIDSNDTDKIASYEAGVESAFVSDDHTLSITLNEEAAAKLEGTAGFDPLDNDDSIELASGFSRDSAGNAGSDDAFDGPSHMDTAVVVFDLVHGVSSDHSQRTFDANVSYTIYVLVDSDTFVLNATPIDGQTGSWGQWTGGGAIGSDDNVVIVGDEGSIGILADIPDNRDTANTSLVYIGNATEHVKIKAAGTFYWRHDTGPMNLYVKTRVLIWDGVAADMQGPAGADHYLQGMPNGVLTSQGLS
ncbi:beta strand repeat-containing protein [Agarivorans sp. QJM3NY_33]|uniref:beta strand repeat-containing protein n=1 Tax=Agarivorans sp. QJM3NY_33 TaxID=3421432 RepID=UPI003D7CBF46